MAVFANVPWLLIVEACAGIVEGGPLVWGKWGEVGGVHIHGDDLVSGWGGALVLLASQGWGLVVSQA